MISANFLINQLLKYGFNFFSGVPCSYLTPVINGVINSKKTRYISAASEGEAVGIASGAWLAGKKSVVMIQNSGLGNTINPLTSLNYPFKIPILLITTWRGEPKTKDEPQHELMGKITKKILRLSKIKNEIFPINEKNLIKVISKINNSIKKSSLPYALIMRKETVKKEELKQKKFFIKKRSTPIIFYKKKKIPTRYKILEEIQKNINNKIAVIATTGKTGRELFTLNDCKNYFYQVGSMGCASAIALGVALNSKKKIMVLDGDGALLMKMGNMSTIGANQPKNLIHILIDNNVHDSTGQQLTNASTVEFANIAINCGYKKSYSTDNTRDFSNILKKNLANTNGPIFIHVKIQKGSILNLGRPTLHPKEVALRFKNFLKN
jgi:phosphonopyruvate decarboxylase